MLVIGFDAVPLVIAQCLSAGENDSLTNQESRKDDRKLLDYLRRRVTAAFGRKAAAVGDQPVVLADLRHSAVAPAM